MTIIHDPITLATRLIQCPSVTPNASHALDIVGDALKRLGFSLTRLPFGEVDNLFATRTTGDKDTEHKNRARHLAFAGHVDVVPTGALSAWRDDPFSGTLRDDALWGRGAVDMKSAIAAAIAAIANQTHEINGTISLIITGDEEGPAINGTAKMVDWLKKQNIQIDDCLIGEPTNPNTLGEMIKIGRRGSLNGIIRIDGVSGHVAYPHLAQNPIAPMLDLLQHLQSLTLDDGSTHFQPSNLEISSVDVGNEAHNVIPGRASARFNIRFNDHWRGKTLSAHVKAHLDASGIAHQLDLTTTGECFLTEPCAFTKILSTAITDITGRTPELSTSGGTSDARFLKDITRTAEFGLIGATMHQANEHIALAAIIQLTEIYQRVIAQYFD